MDILETVMFFDNGNIACFGKDGEQVPPEQGSAWLMILQEKLERKVIGPNTKVKMAGWVKTWTVAELIQAGKLKQK